MLPRHLFRVALPLFGREKGGFTKHGLGDQGVEAGLRSTGLVHEGAELARVKHSASVHGRDVSLLPLYHLSLLQDLRQQLLVNGGD
jgi:hypothetical protein